MIWILFKLAERHDLPFSFLFFCFAIWVKQPFKSKRAENKCWHGNASMIAVHGSRMSFVNVCLHPCSFGTSNPAQSGDLCLSCPVHDGVGILGASVVQLLPKHNMNRVRLITESYGY